MAVPLDWLTCANARPIRANYHRRDGLFFRYPRQDSIGVDCADLHAVKAQAAVSLAELAREVLPGSIKRVISVEVRDEVQPILTDVLTFEAIILAN